MKTIREWFQTLREPYRTQALNNENKLFHSGYKKGSLSSAILNGFNWKTSPEGYDYWDAIHGDMVSSGTEKYTQPPAPIPKYKIIRNNDFIYL